MFMLKMMYKLSREESNIEGYWPEMLLRTGPKVKMKIAFTNKERVRFTTYVITCGTNWTVRYNWQRML